MATNFKVSFVVDQNPVHYYQAELLLFSLDHFAKQKKENILVHCTSRVDNDFLEFLSTNGYSVRIIEPYLDGKYCNKVKQLEAFYLDDNCDGVFLLDTDVFALEPLLPADTTKFCAKVVDAENPPLQVLKNIFDAAGLPYDREIECDWLGTTFASNFNGGYYYIPQKDLIALSEGWKKWANWLYSNSELFDVPGQAIHTDQVSMSLAISEAGLELCNAASNFNCPIHSLNFQKYFDPIKPVYLLHYHGEINVFGLLDKTRASNPAIEQSICKANDSIACHAPFTFFAVYRKSLIQPALFTKKSTHVLSKLSALARKYDRKPRIILHGGTSKTASTSLQFFLDGHHDELKRSGILYPTVYMKHTFDPKHQWIMRSLITADADMWVDNFLSIFFQLSEDTHTIILSTEGIHNHWKDFSQESKSFLSVLAEVFEVEFWVWFREPVSYMYSLYRQNLKNPRSEVSCYGQDISFTELLRDKWFFEHLDYLGFIFEMETIFKNNVSIFQYNGDVLSYAKERFKLTERVVKERENIGLSGAGIELLRIVNRFPLDGKEKEHCVYLLTQVDHILNNYTQTKEENTEAISEIKQAMANQKSILKSAYLLNF